ncbi:MAG: restriction endonuclease subunit S [Clostridia bacterium]|nr:restriction endonuclease subunit S [Clostridia bacterium]
MNLNVSDWKPFRVGRLFTMFNGKGITQEEIADNEGGFIAVQSGEENNGVMGKIDFNYCKQMNYTYSEKPCLTVARSGSAGFVSYQNDGCVVGDSAKILLLPDRVATIEHYLFLQTILTANRFKYTYGRKVTEDKYLNDIVDLPVQHNADGSIYIDSSYEYSDDGYVPDWQFMEDYIKSLHHKPLTTIIKKGQAPDLHVDEWKEFTIPKLFGEVKIAKSADIGNLEEGVVPFVGRTDIDNGIQGFVSPREVTKGHCITISMVGTNVALYQEKDFQASQNISILRKEIISKEMALFICSIINYEMRLKYSYGRTVGKTNIEQMILKLPADLDGNPDWQFMEDYIKSLPYGDRI